MAYKEDLDIGKITLIGLVSVLLAVAIVVFLQVLFYGFKQRQLASPRYSQVPAEMTKYLADQQGKLASFEVVDRERKIVTMPIDGAMRRVVEELAADPRAHVTGVLDPADVVETPPPPAAGSGGQGPPDDSAEPAPGKGSEAGRTNPSVEEDAKNGAAGGAPAGATGEPPAAADDEPATGPGDNPEKRAEDTSDARS